MQEPKRIDFASPRVEEVRQNSPPPPEPLSEDKDCPCKHCLSLPEEALLAAAYNQIKSLKRELDERKRQEADADMAAHMASLGSGKPVAPTPADEHEVADWDLDDDMKSAEDTIVTPDGVKASWLILPPLLRDSHDQAR